MILLTGGTGYIGNKLLEKLMANDLPIRLMYRSKVSGQRNYPYTVQPIPGNLKDRRSLAEAARDCAGIVHLASPMSLSFLKTVREEVIGTYTLLKNWRRGPFIFASSMSVYRPCPHPIVENHAKFCFGNSYAMGKIICEKLVRRRAQVIGRPFVIVRIPHVFDTDALPPSTLLHWITAKALAHEDFILPLKYIDNKLDYGTSWISREDLSQFILKAILSPRKGCFNVASGFISWVDLIESVISSTKSGSRLHFQRHTGGNLFYRLKRSELSVDKVKADYGFSPRSHLGWEALSVH